MSLQSFEVRVTGLIQTDDAPEDWEMLLRRTVAECAARIGDLECVRYVGVG